MTHKRQTMCEKKISTIRGQKDMIRGDREGDKR